MGEVKFTPNINLQNRPKFANILRTRLPIDQSKNVNIPRGYNIDYFFVLEYWKYYIFKSKE